MTRGEGAISTEGRKPLARSGERETDPLANHRIIAT
jgi:hypothetical protein